MTRIGFLHTAEAHVATFAGVLGREDPSATAAHVVDQTLLADAIERGGPDEDLQKRIALRLDELEHQQVDVTLCTCTTIGAGAEMVARGRAVAVRRIDRAMAETAARSGGRVAVVGALESAVLSTRRLIEEEAEIAGARPTVHDVLVPDAWGRFEAGDLAGYHDRVAEEAVRASSRFDVIVLAQASMAAIADRLAHLPCLVLSSPASAVRAALREARAMRRQA